ncbi:hypothetical protein GCM10017786_01280 [Amycolatopsis deserti]|uniref:SnoaL-like domain-containing protein n=1 Tax=Amycolatopsis deserti TaxID=185696 RepID=A0ABQ3IA22_9PSEU|nr:hypothetical protein [Amycolatopsis deserti]GHE76116.1 hypothetical protein GCM10017786_01280 [Amycolatopsis deserti]
MADLTLEEMEQILYRHEMAELSKDLDATMATVVANPHYEFPSWGWAADGPEAVREHYRRALADIDRGDPASKMRVHGVGPNTLFREASFSFNREDGERVTGQYLAVIEFDPVEKKVKSERQYGDSVFAEYLAPHCGPDYGEIPGVSRLNSNITPITREDMYAEAGRALDD